MGLKTQNGYFIENGSDDFDRISMCMENYRPKQT
jgi:hypothetical protein